MSLASQTHHVPHIGLPHMEPVTSVKKVKSAPIFAEDIDKISKIFILHTSEIIEQKTSTEYAKSDNHALGTWT